MDVRSTIAAGLVFTTVTLASPTRAVAEEPAAAPTPASSGVDAGRRPFEPLALGSRELPTTLGLGTLRTPGVISLALPGSPRPNASAMDEIRLSSGAKTAIIVTAIVVGVLIIAGVIAIGAPHRHL